MRLVEPLIAGVALALVGGSAIADDDTKWLPNRRLTPELSPTRAPL
jgi:hypothetical protein